MKLQIKIKENFRLWFCFTIIYFFIQNFVRTFLISQKLPSVLNLTGIYLVGFLWDFYFWIFISIPFVILSYFLSPSKHSSFLNHKSFQVFIFFVSFILSFVGFCELVFWGEFRSRFNFIAVDYLVYTNEVLSNIQESFPMGLIIFGLFCISIFISFVISRINFLEWNKNSLISKKYSLLFLGLIIPSFFSLGIAPWLDGLNDNFRLDQLSRNGYIEFVRAFRSNHIDYKNFYLTLPDKEVEDIMHSKNLPHADIDEFKHLNKPNIVFIVVESLGAKFIAPLGGDKRTTPFLNDLSTKSLFFNNFYATGTRTVRGLEAINLSVPPTPGYAVVKRPNHKNLYSLGHTFKTNGYDPIFLYGGNGFFDNMNSFFENNDFTVFDIGDFSKNEISFKNAWGVCDEDLFNKAISVLGKRDSKNPFLLFMLTTSNHRPFTYPDGKIDIPSGTSRAGAVKYSDFAIGEFLKNAVKQDWAKNSIFVVVADHSTEGRGRFELEMKDFHIPLFIYSPTLLNPKVVSKISSQIDLLPTLIHMIGLNDQSPFYGKSVFNPNWKEERAFVGNYQYVGYYKDELLVTLGPNSVKHHFSYDPKSKKQKKISLDSPLDKEAISYYQSASTGLKNGAHNHSDPKN